MAKNQNQQNQHSLEGIRAELAAIEGPLLARYGAIAREEALAVLDRALVAIDPDYVPQAELEPEPLKRSAGYERGLPPDGRATDHARDVDMMHTGAPRPRR